MVRLLREAAVRDSSSAWSLLWRLIEPHPAVRDGVQRERARFVALLLLFLPTVSIAGVALQVLAQPEIAWTLTYQLPMIALGYGLYALARSTRWEIALWATILLAVVSTAVAIASRPETTVVYAYLLVPALLATALLGNRESVGVALAMFAMAAVLGALWPPGPGSGRYGSMLVTLGILLSLEVLANRHRVRIERERQREIARRDAVSRRLLEASFGGLALVREGRIREANQGFAELFGEEARGLVGRPIADFLPAEVPLASFDSAGRREVTGRRRDGTYVPVAVVTRLDSDPEGSSHVVAVQDLSDREALRARIHQSDRMAAMGQLAAGVAHEINNPLTWIIGNLEQIVDAVPSEQRRQVEQAIDGARRVRRIARDLRTFARDRGGPVVGVDVGEVARSAVNMVRHDLHHNGTLREDYGEAPSIDGDPTRLGQVFMNLLTNAAQAIVDDGGTEVSVRIGTDDAGWATFVVEDDGPGIPPELTSRVFEPFFSTKTDGTGLGLAISRTLVEEMGGELLLDRGRERGARMEVRLPPGSLALAAPENTDEERRAPTRVARILVIDDEPAICELLQAALGEHQVEAATHGEEGLSRALDESWDVVLCDLMMPGVTGMDIYAALRDRAPGRESRVVFLTGGAFTSGARAFVDTVPNPVLHKPFRLGHVRDTVAEMIERQ